MNIIISQLLIIIFCISCEACTRPNADAAGLWVLGGQGGDADGSRVWHSADGGAWIAEEVVAPFPPRWYHQAAAFLGNLWVLGGAYQEGMGLGLRNDVWRLSTDNFR